MRFTLGVLTRARGWKLGRLGPFGTGRGRWASAAVPQGRPGTHPKFAMYHKMVLCMRMTHAAQDDMGQKKYSRTGSRTPQGPFDNF